MNLQVLIEELQKLHNTHWDLDVVIQNQKSSTDKIITNIYFDDYEGEKIILEFINLC